MKGREEGDDREGREGEDEGGRSRTHSFFSKKHPRKEAVPTLMSFTENNHLLKVCFSTQLSWGLIFPHINFERTHSNHYNLKAPVVNRVRVGARPARERRLLGS